MVVCLIIGALRCIRIVVLQAPDVKASDAHSTKVLHVYFASVPIVSET